MTLNFSTNWLDRQPKPSKDELEATLAALRIIVSEVNVTEYIPVIEGTRRPGDDVSQEKLHMPLYFLAEWAAENWWPLLNEPRKSEKSDDVAFSLRHSLLSAQHGFVLPDLQIEPLGQAVRITCRGREAPLAGIRFKNTATAIMDREAVAATLSTFVRTCVQRLADCGVDKTPLQRAWQRVDETTSEQVTYCSLVGALGVDPYGASSALSAAIDGLFDHFGEEATLDLCLASTENDLLAARNVAGLVADRLNGAHEITLAPLWNLRLGSDSNAHPSWRRGQQAAENVRKVLDINPSDRLGADKFFDRLRISTEPLNSPSDSETESAVFTGAIDRFHDTANVILLQSREEARRFAASRAVFLAAVSDKPSTRRLVTNALTRDQQASRAFAAELLVPFKNLRAQTNGQKLSRDSINAIARERRASVDVVIYQATNNGLVVESPI